MYKRQPDRQKDIDAKMAEVQKKASEGSLFGEEPFMQASQQMCIRDRNSSIFFPGSGHAGRMARHTPYQLSLIHICKGLFKRTVTPLG